MIVLRQGKTATPNTLVTLIEYREDEKMESQDATTENQCKAFRKVVRYLPRMGREGEQRSAGTTHMSQYHAQRGYCAALMAFACDGKER